MAAKDGSELGERRSAGCPEQEQLEPCRVAYSGRAFSGLINNQGRHHSGKIGKAVFEAMLEDGSDVDQIIESRGLKQVTDSGAIELLVDEVITNHPEQVQQFKDGKEAVLGFLVGQAMKLSEGKANPGQVNQLLREKMQ